MDFGNGTRAGGAVISNVMENQRQEITTVVNDFESLWESLKGSVPDMEVVVVDFLGGKGSELQPL